MRYSDSTQHSSLHLATIDSHPPQHSSFGPSFFNTPGLPPTSLSSPSNFAQEPNPYYQPPHHIISRLGSSANSSSMASHGPHRNPMSTPTISARDQYAGDTPTFRRPSEHPSRSPSYPGTHRRGQPLSPTPSPMQDFTSPPRMDGGYGLKPSGAIPPLGALTSLGQLEYVEGGNGTNSVTPVKCDISGAIDKGFFLAEGDWTCYRRNYFSCTCSFTLSPMQYPGMQIRYVCDDNIYPVRGFFMSISANVSDENNQPIELVQHTPKRDKGPVSKPDKVALAPKQPMSHQSLASMYHGHDGSEGMIGGPPRNLYDPTTGFPNPQQQGPGSFQTEYTFERIQFKQATANNGKRRAAQQYYHLCVELWADCSNGTGPERFIQVAFRKSAKMIVRGRSPGHYSDNRRNSTSNGPGGSTGSLNGFPTSSGVLGPADFAANGGLGGTGFTGPYEPRGGAPPPPPGLHYGALRGPRDIPHEAYVSPEEDKAIHTNKEYQYFPGSIYEGQQDSRHGITMFTHHQHHHRPEDDNTLMPVAMGGPYDGNVDNRVKPEGDGSSAGGAGVGGGHSSHNANGGGGGSGMPLPSIFSPGVGVSSRRCQPFESKHSSANYFPTLMPQMGLGHLANIS